MLRLCEDESRDVQQGTSDALNRLTQFLPETLLPRLRYILFKDLQRTVNLPRQLWTAATYRRLKSLLTRFSNLASSIKPQKCKPFAQHIVPILNALLSSTEEVLQSTLANASKTLIHSLGHVFTGA